MGSYHHSIQGLVGLCAFREMVILADAGTRQLRWLDASSAPGWALDRAYQAVPGLGPNVTSVSMAVTSIESGSSILSMVDSNQKLHLFHVVVEEERKADRRGLTVTALARLDSEMLVDHVRWSAVCCAPDLPRVICLLARASIDVSAKRSKGVELYHWSEPSQGEGRVLELFAETSSTRVDALAQRDGRIFALNSETKCVHVLSTRDGKEAGRISYDDEGHWTLRLRRIAVSEGMLIGVGMGVLSVARISELPFAIDTVDTNTAAATAVARANAASTDGRITAS